MAQLWGGRFTKETDKLVYNFNASISFDQKFYAQDIRGSIAHVTMLQKQGILTKEEKESIIEGLKGIQADVENGTLEITDEYEDIHSFVEANLIDRIGDAGKKLHTGRSRNDQVALDMRLYTRDEIEALDTLLKELLEVLLKLMKEHIETYMPGFTHLQKAQPVTLAHHLGAYFEMFKRFFINEKAYRLQIFFHSCHLYVFISCQMIVFLLCKIIQNQFCRTTDSCIVTKCCKGKFYIFIRKERILLKWLFYIFKKNLSGF